MSRLVLIIVLFVAAFPSKSHAYFYFGGGADFTFFHLKELNKVVDRYNSTHGTTLVSKFDNVEYLLGPSAFFGNVSKSGFTFELSWKTNLEKLEAKYIDGGINYTREVKVRYHEVGPGIGYTFTRLSPLRPGFLGFVNAGTIAELTRNGTESSISDVDFTRVNRQFHLGFTIMAQVMLAGDKAPIGISVRPYYHFGFLKIDHTELNDAINDIKNNGTEKYEDKNHYFGLQLSLIFKSRD